MALLDLLKQFGEPLFPTREEAVAYLTRELERAVPQGWAVRRVSNTALVWKVVKQEIKPGEWPHQDYEVRISKSLDTIMFLHSNSDAGVLGMHHYLIRCDDHRGGSAQAFRHGRVSEVRHVRVQAE